MITPNGNVVLQGAQVFAKNFAGGKFRDGKRSVGFKLPFELGEELHRLGWPINRLLPNPDDPNGVETHCVYAKVRFDIVPPVIVMIDRHGKTKLDEQSVGQLDWTRIGSCDVVLHPSSYPASNGRPGGISVYVKTLYATIIEDDEFYERYADIPFRDFE